MQGEDREFLRGLGIEPADIVDVGPPAEALPPGAIPAVVVTVDGVEYREFCVRYRYADRTWSLTLMASSFEDAEGRVQALKSAVLDGQLEFSLPVEEDDID